MEANRLSPFETIIDALETQIQEARADGRAIDDLGEATKTLIENVTNLGVRAHFSLNQPGAEDLDSQGCKEIEKFRNPTIPFDKKVGIPPEFELKTRVYRANDTYIFVNLRGNARVSETKLLECLNQSCGLNLSGPLEVADLSELGSGHGLVTPFLEIPENHNAIYLFDEDLTLMPSARNAVMTNAHHPHISIEMNLDALMEALMKKHGNGVHVASVCENPSTVLRHTDVFFKHEFHVLGGNGPDTLKEFTEKFRFYVKRILDELGASASADLLSPRLTGWSNPLSVLSMNWKSHGPDVMMEDAQSIERVKMTIPLGRIATIAMPCNTRASGDQQHRETASPHRYFSIAEAGLNALLDLDIKDREKILLVAGKAANDYTYTDDRLSPLRVSGSTICRPDPAEIIALNRIVYQIKQDAKNMTTQTNFPGRIELIQWLRDVLRKSETTTIAVANTEVGLLIPSLMREPDFRKLKWVDFVDAGARHMALDGFQLPRNFLDKASRLA
jgi:hypothetical protein